VSFGLVHPLLFPYISEGMLPLAYSYLFVISLMVLLSPAGESLWLRRGATENSKVDGRDSGGSNRQRGSIMERDINWRFVARVVGSILFYLSDVFVARAEFIDRTDPVNRMVGLPL